MASGPTGSSNANPKILVTGDLIREVHVYQGSRPFASTAAASGSRVSDHDTFGGAMLVHEILAGPTPPAGSRCLAGHCASQPPHRVPRQRESLQALGDPRPELGSR